MKHLYLLALALFSAGASNAQILQQNFTSASGTTPPAGWTATDVANADVNWVFDNPGGRTIQSPMAGKVAILDSDWFGTSEVPEDAYLTSPVFNASVLNGNLILSFDHTFRTAGVATWAVEVYDGVTWTEVIDGSSDIDTPENIYIDISSEAGLSANAQIRFHWTGEWDYFWMIDNVVVFDETCPPVSGLATSTITSSGATAIWTAGGSETDWSVSYGPVGFTPESGTIQDVDTDPEYSISGLNTGQTYQFYVRAECSATDSSVWEGPYTFTTTCVPAPITSLPYLENFNNAVVPALPCGWTSEDANADTEEWLTEEWDTGDNVLILYYSSDGVTDSDDWAFTPEFVLEAGTNYQLNFEEYSGLGFFVENLGVSIGSAANSAAMTTSILDLPSISSGDFTPHQVFFTVPADGSYYIGFHGYSEADQLAVLIDNVQLAVAPDCPAVTTAAISGVVGDNATVSWSAALSETQWIVEYGEAGFTPGSGETVTVSTTPSTILDELESGTDYDVYIYAVCSATEESEAFGPVSFTSQCVVPVVTSYPWTEDFDSAELDEMPCGWIQYDVNEDDYFWAVSDVQPKQGPNSLRIAYNYDEDMNDWAMTPGFQMAGGVEYTISFAYSVYSEDFPESFGLFAGTSQTVAGMTISLEDFPEISNELYQDTTISFIPPSTGVYYFGFHGYSIAGQWDLFIDSVVVDENCQEESANIVYERQTLCSYNNPSTPAVNGTTGGVFSSTPGLTIDPSTGTITPSTSTNGSYVITYITSGSTCADTTTLTINISPCLGIDESVLSSVQLYPNPSNGKVQMTISELTSDMIYSVTDITGKVVIEPLKLSGTETAIDLSNEADGIYFVTLSAEGLSRSYRIVLSK